ncbi:hypothetical protein GOARA_060_00080 [Gordonia araii NBRC 100433]|uniref:UDP-N-acetylglucosamine kinase n=1 Tax=Gordonia araii NBRC 100433 TaxID=1073574 RepID=G7H3Y2_9ACTN|nr:zeta toxin family protein [Gordonia araii]NNG98920.1 AAA family ATPase [Gordonia araii NBRC 100433]GAB10557.1 hypothetical protein GOARA_060_00080 [Gordonia araii NBRC 100433]
MTSPRLDLVVGCNGAGKSSLIHTFLLPRLPGSTYVNADDIALQRWPDATEAKSYEAAQIAARTREALIEARVPFIAETVFSHPSKLDLISRAHDHGFRVVLHVVMVPEELAVLRVLTRTESGGHSVPEKKVRERYQRVWPLAAQAVERVDRARVYDNSGAAMRLVAQFEAGIAMTADWPAWTPEAIRSLHPLD